MYMYRHIPEIKFFMPTIQGEVFNCEYEIEVSLYFDSFLNNNYRLKVTIPITVVHEDIDEYMEKQGINMKIIKDKMLNKDSITPGNIILNEKNNTETEDKSTDKGDMEFKSNINCNSSNSKSMITKDNIDKTEGNSINMISEDNSENTLEGVDEKNGNYY